MCYYIEQMDVKCNNGIFIISKVLPLYDIINIISTYHKTNFFSTSQWQNTLKIEKLPIWSVKKLRMKNEAIWSQFSLGIVI